MDTRFNLNRLVYFVATVEEGTITAAAERLGLSKAVVSKQLQLLEEQLGVALLQRNTRHMQPTETGRLFYDKSKYVLEQANEAFDLVLDQGQVPAGRIRVTAPVDYGVSQLSPMVAKFCEKYPRIDVELMLSDDVIDIVEQRFDVAFRIGWLKDSSNLARKLRDFNEIAVCSSETAELKPITKPEDLASLPFVANLAIGGQTKWKFQCDDTYRTVDLLPTLSMNITLATRSAVVAGRGFTILPDFLVAEELASGKLVHLLPDWNLRSGGVYAVSPPSRLRSSAVRVFLEMVQEYTVSDAA